MTEVLLATALYDVPGENLDHGTSLGILDPELVKLELSFEKPIATAADRVLQLSPEAFEAEFSPEFATDDFEAIERQRLLDLPSDGFPEGSGIKEQLIDGLLVIGQPTRNINSFGFGTDEGT